MSKPSAQIGNFLEVICNSEALRLSCKDTIHIIPIITGNSSNVTDYLPVYRTFLIKELSIIHLVGIYYLM